MPSARSKARSADTFLAAVRATAGAAERDGTFPWSVPALRAFDELAFPTPVTFLMGENGCGKSTLLEALAIATNAVAAGASDLARDPTLAGARRFANALVVTSAFRRRPRSRMFFRAEDALGFGRRLEDEMAELGELARSIDDEAASSGDPAGGKRRAAGYVRGQRGALARRYGEDPHAQSHGEAFLRILCERLVPGGLYFLDEPETPLSPTRVLALLVTIRASVRVGSQFVIATHSPLLAALPGATIYAIAGETIVATPYEELEHVRVTRDFLNAPERYLRLLEDPG